jgi:predicted RND superfamily exporter protein
MLAYIDRLENEIAKEQNVNSVSGITDLLKSANGGVLPASSATSGL